MGCRGCAPGIQITPAQGKAAPGASSPVTTSVPSPTTTLAVEELPVSWSVVTSHAPKFASNPSSKSATRFSAGAGGDLGLRPGPYATNCTIHEVSVLSDRDDVVAARLVILEVAAHQH